MSSNGDFAIGQSSLLSGTQSGRLTWNNRNLVRSINNRVANNDGNITLNDLAFKDQIVSSDIGGQLSTSQIAGLNYLAFKDQITSADISGYLSTNQIIGLCSLAFKEQITSADING